MRGSETDATVEPEKVNPRLGARLRAARESLGLTLRSLADSMGVTASLLSQIETDKVQPSLNTLYLLVSRLGLSMDALLGVGDGRSEGPFMAETRPTVQRMGENPALVLSSGVKWERLAGGAEETMEPLVITYPPHTSSSPTGGLSQYEGYEYGLLLEGRLTLKLGFDRYELSAGDSVHFDAQRPHEYVNETDEPARGVWFVLRDELLRVRARLGSWRPGPTAAVSPSALQATWDLVDQTDW